MKRKKVDVGIEIILSITMLGKILATIFLSRTPGIAALHWAGFIILLLSAVFGWLPIFTLKKHGRTEEGKSYIHTTQLVDRGIYGIVRHPQYLAGILICIGLALIAQSLLSILLGGISVGIFSTVSARKIRATVKNWGPLMKNMQNGSRGLIFS